MSQLNVFLFDRFRNQGLSKGPSNKMPTLTCPCLQALGEALKVNGSVTEIYLGCDHLGDEGSRPGVWWALLNAAACHDVIFPTSCDSEKFGWFGGAVVSSLTFHREESCQIRRFVAE